MARRIFTLESAAVLQASGCAGPVGRRAQGARFWTSARAPKLGNSVIFSQPDATIVTRHHAADREVQGAEAQLP